MTFVELLAIGVVFSIGVITGVILVVSLASRREDRRANLSREAPDRVAHAGRFLTGLYVRRPGDGTSRRDQSDDDQSNGDQSNGEQPDDDHAAPFSGLRRSGPALLGPGA